jgi:hypothetical protein
MGEVETVASDIASEIVAALTGTKPQKADVSGAIAKAIKG